MPVKTFKFGRKPSKLPEGATAPADAPPEGLAPGEYIVLPAQGFKDICGQITRNELNGEAAVKALEGLVPSEVEDKTEEKKKELPISLGDEIQAKELFEGYFDKNDRGRVSSEPYVDGKDGKLKFKVTWYRTGKTSVRVHDGWTNGFTMVGKAGQPSLGDELQCLPLEKFEGYFEPGDKGRVSGEPYVGDDGQVRFKVTWYRTGKTSLRLANGWMQGFKLIGRARAPAMGDEMQVLPLEKFEGYFQPGEKGKVSSEHYTDDDGKLKFKVTWQRSGKTSVRLAHNWMCGFRFAERDDALIEPEQKASMEGAVKDSNLATGKPMELISGQPKAAAMGLFHFMRVKDPFAEDSTDRLEGEVKGFASRLKECAVILTSFDSVPGERSRLERIYGKERVADAKDEIDYFRKLAWLPDDASALAVAERVAEETVGNLNYILYEKSSEVYVKGPNAIRDKGRGAVTLDTFMKDPNVKDAELTKAHVVGLRFYTTTAYKYLNAPMRSQDRYYDKCRPHPLPITMSYVSEGIKKLRAAYAYKVEQGTAKSQLTLWRGMKNMQIAKAFLENRKGGTELAPMSTTTDITVASKYACSGESLLFKISLDNFMQYGAELGWLSAFPGEVEVLYPPLTYLQPTERAPQKVQLKGGQTFTIYEVKPTIP